MAKRHWKKKRSRAFIEPSTDDKSQAQDQPQRKARKLTKVTREKQKRPTEKQDSIMKTSSSLELSEVPATSNVSPTAKMMNPDSADGNSQPKNPATKTPPPQTSEVEIPEKVLPEGIGLLQWMKAWPGADGANAPHWLDVAKEFNVWNDKLVNKRLDLALDNIFGGGFAHEYRILQRIEQKKFNPAATVEHILRERGISWHDSGGKLRLSGAFVRVIDYTSQASLNVSNATNENQTDVMTNKLPTTPYIDSSSIKATATSSHVTEQSFQAGLLTPTPLTHREHTPSPLENKIIEKACDAATALSMLELVHDERRLRKTWRERNSRQLRSATKKES